MHNGQTKGSFSLKSKKSLADRATFQNQWPTGKDWYSPGQIVEDTSQTSELYYAFLNSERLRESFPQLSS